MSVSGRPQSDVDNDVLTQGRINVYTMSYFEHLGQLLNSVSLEDWKTYLAWHLVSSNAYVLIASSRFNGGSVNGQWVQLMRVGPWFSYCRASSGRRMRGGGRS